MHKPRGEEADKGRSDPSEPKPKTKLQSFSCRQMTLQLDPPSCHCSRVSPVSPDGLMVGKARVSRRHAVPELWRRVWQPPPWHKCSWKNRETERGWLSRFIFYYYYYSSKNSRSLIRLTILLYSYKNVCACDLCVYETVCVCENVRDCAYVCLLTEVYRASITKKPVFTKESLTPLACYRSGKQNKERKSRGRRRKKDNQRAVKG